MSIQETINSENLNKLYNYYEKFSTYYPDWGKYIYENLVGQILSWISSLFFLLSSFYYSLMLPCVLPCCKIV